MSRRPPRSPPFPSTTLFRSRAEVVRLLEHGQPVAATPVRAALPAAVAAGVPGGDAAVPAREVGAVGDRKSTRLNSSHANISYAVFCLKKKTTTTAERRGVSA